MQALRSPGGEHGRWGGLQHRRDGRLSRALYAAGPGRQHAITAELTYDSRNLTVVGVRRAAAARGTALAANTNDAGRLQVALASAHGFDEGAPLVLVLFEPRAER